MQALVGRRAYLRLIVLIALHTGMCRGEILRLRKQHIGFHRGEIQVTKTKTDKSGYSSNCHGAGPAILQFGENNSSTIG
jgi:integrase